MGQKKVFKSIKNNIKKMHWGLFFAVLFLVGFGLLNIITASSRETVVTYEYSLLHYFNRHLIMIIISVVISFFVINLPTTFYLFLGPIMGLINTSLLIGIFFKGVGKRGSNNWINIGPLQFQPSEIAKPIMIIILAIAFEWFYKILQNKDLPLKKKLFTIIKTFIIPALFPLIVFVQKDFGTCVILGMILLVMFLLSPLQKKDKQNLTIIGVTLLSLMVGVYSMLKGSIFTTEQMSRIDKFFNPCSNYEAGGYQVCNALIAVNNGNLTGLGIGKSKQKYSYIPDPHTDSVFAIIAEEQGLLFGTVIFITYTYILCVIFKLARTSPTIRGRYMALGIGTYFGTHICLNLGGLLAVIPLTGVPLPFLSYGGTFTISLLSAMAVIQRINIEKNIYFEKQNN